MYLRRNSQFSEPVLENGVCHRFSLLVGNFSDHSVLGESFRDAKDKFFITVRCEHWAKKVSVNPEVWTFWDREPMGVPMEFFCLSMFSVAGIAGRNFGVVRCLASFLAKSRR
jgi:hypothetical protein